MSYLIYIHLYLTYFTGIFKISYVHQNSLLEERITFRRDFKKKYIFPRILHSVAIR